MRRGMAIVLASGMMIQGCASTPGAGHGGAAGTDRFEAVNRALEGQLAAVELENGEVVRDAEDVKMTAVSTSWHVDERGRTVPTAEVRKVTRLMQRRVAKGLGYGAAVGAVAGWVVATHQAKDRGIYFSNSQEAAFVEVLVACAVAGMFVTGVLRKPPDRVVYTAPDAGAHPAGGGSALLAPSGAGGSQHCRLAAQDAAPGAPAIVCGPAMPAGGAAAALLR